MYIYTKVLIPRSAHTNTCAYTQTDRQTGRHTGRQIQRETERQKQRDRVGVGQRDRYTDRQGKRDREANRETEELYSETDTERDRGTHSPTDKEGG